LVIHPDPNMQPTVTADAARVDDDVAEALGIKDKPRPGAASVPKPGAASPATAKVTGQAPPARPVTPNAPQARPQATMATAIGATSVPHAAPQLNATSVMPSASSVMASVKGPPLPAAPQPPVPQVVPDAPDDAAAEISLGTTLGGYEVLQKLGAGGMGAVYLARQVSLDRNVALKTLHPNLARDPQLVSRFTREAYAAAQLTHHNIVQIHDIGQDRQINFFSMEYVTGQTLAHVLRDTPKLDVETAVTYALQAARGLKFAHDHGLIHRDIKPENLLLNDQGIVKVADLGLVKKVGGHETMDMQAERAQQSGVAVTQMNKSMGTPLYMPPEQAEDAARVDHRADIYSLGCTLYHLITGRPPFTGRTAGEVITKHQHEPVTPPDVVVKDVPAALSPIIVRMLAKSPDDRYANMKEVIDALEGFLGIASTGPYTPKDDQVKILEYAAERYNANTLARLKPKLILGYYAACVLLAVLLADLYRGEPVWAGNHAGGMVGLAVLTTLAYQVTVGIMQRTHLFRRARQLVFGAGIVDWILWAGAAVIFGYVLYAFGLWVPWMVAAVLSVLLSQAFYWVTDAGAARERDKYLKQAEQLMKQMRLKGLDENAIRQFVARFSGRHWEAFFENLFGYEAKLQARAVWGKERGRDRPKFAAWREPVIAYIEHRIESRKQIKEARLLQKLEQKALQAKGIDEKLARKQAGKNAQRLVGSAAVMRRESEKHAAQSIAQTAAPPPAKGKGVSMRETAPPRETAAPVSRMAATLIGDGAVEEKNLPHDYDSEYVRESYFRRRYGTPVQFLTGSLLRFGLSLVLLAIFANWWNVAHATDIVTSAKQITSAEAVEATKLVASKRANSAEIISQAKAGMATKEGTHKVTVAFLPDRWTDSLNPYAFAVAGLLLLVGCIYSGRALGIAMYLVAAIALFGYVITLPVVGQLNFFITSLIALGLWMFSVIFLRVKRD
jgi:tRNA A-37 threonylcarbamoyl transferase component Bud32